MAIKTWAQLGANECVAHAEVENAVATGQLLWSGSNPGLAPGYCYTRDDFETYLLHSDMSASGIASNELMTRSEMETYRLLVGITDTAQHSESFGATWQGWVEFSVTAAVNSVYVERSINGGAFSELQTMNVTPGSSGNGTQVVNVATGSTLRFRLTPYSGANGTGTAGAAVTVNVFEP